MRSRWKTIIGFALLGLLVALILYFRALRFDYTKPLSPMDRALGLASFIFCPPTLLLILCIDCEITGWDGLIIFTIIGFLNAALYAAIGAAFVSLRNRSG